MALFARRFSVGILLLSVATTALNAAEEETRQAAEKPAVVGLATEFFPLPVEHDKFLQDRLYREIVRQAVLLAAREELGLATRDETLGEPLPEAADGQPGVLRLELRATHEGEYTARLFAADASADAPLLEIAGKVKSQPRSLYAELARNMIAKTPTIAKALRESGFAGEAAPLNADNAPTAAAERLLGEMNFVSQFGAVRAAHRAMAENGPSLAWLGVLVRGYANLSLLTEHLWSSQQEAFAARSLLYAERMMALDDASELAQRHRAYALAVVGMHREALDQLEKLDASAGAASAAGAAPAWLALLRPYCEFNHAALAKTAQSEGETEELAVALLWQQYRSYQHGRWTYGKGLETAKRCPEIYGVYDALAHTGALLVKRTGAYSGPPVFGWRVPRRVGRLADLPAEVAELTVPAEDEDFSRGGDREELNEEALSPRPMHLARTLVAATRNEPTPSDLSWAALAALIAEEQFVEVANFLSVSRDGVEHSLAEFVERVLPLVERHRYAAHVRGYALDSRRAPQEFNANLQYLKIVDPRGNMLPMFYQAWTQPASEFGIDGRILSWRATWNRNFTCGGMLESIYRTGNHWWTQFEPKDRKRLAQEMRQVSPRWPNGFRLIIENAEKIDAERLAKWESQATDDPILWITLGKRYDSLGDFEAAARCYKRSYDVSPCYESTVGLASAYRNGGKPELWEPALKAYLEVEDLGLAHAKIHQLLADELIEERKWAAAEPHALAAAETYSAWGMSLASRVYEGMQDWEKSEQWIAEAAQNYPSYYSGADWYFWCCRTGRGDVDEAARYARHYVRIASARLTLLADHYCVTFAILDNDPRGAWERLVFASNCPETLEPEWDKVWRLFHTIALTRELKEREASAAALAELRQYLKTKAEANAHDGNRQWYEAAEALCDAFSNAKDAAIDDAFLKTFDERLARTDANNIASFSYFMGAALDFRGRDAEAERYWRRAAFGGPFSNLNATLAGRQLVSRHGPERGGIPPELAAQDAAGLADKEAALEEGAAPADEEPAESKSAGD